MSHAAEVDSNDTISRRPSGVAADIVGQSPAFLAMLDQLRRIARSEAPVLIEGETGSGKELAARFIHYGGVRRAGPFVPVNCGALPDHLIEAELFGHERGAFTDARTARRGLVAEANGGTLFLDEVDALSLKAQIALLRFLQDQHYRPLGSSRELSTRVRVVAASNQGLAELVQQGRFRADLLYRLKILELALPPLRERLGDAIQLAQHFVAVYSVKYGMPAKAFDEATLGWIDSYPWPGNVRELENWVHRELLMADGPSISTSVGAPASDAVIKFQRAKAEAVRRFERDYVMRVLRKAQGNVTRAAQLAGKDRRAFGKLVKKYGIDRLTPAA
jgi:two-component system, NtrC family, response regulator GlrR